MEEAIVNAVFENLNFLIQNEFRLLWGVNDEVKKLSSTLSTIRAVLADAEGKRMKNREIQDWLRKLKDAAYDADDILDECATEASRPRIWSWIHQYNVLFRHKIGKRIKNIGERLHGIAEERIKFHLQEGVVESRIEARDGRETGFILTQSQVYGRDEDREKIVAFLVKDASSCDDLSIYPILGMGGLGKTTLAQLVFNDERVKEHFEKSIWVCVSEDFDVKGLIKAIIRSTDPNANCETLELAPLQGQLRQLLNGKRYLLVLDDVWNEDQEKWDELKHVLLCGSKGASIIVTTRVKKVASIMGTLPPHDLSSLSEEDCWSLFRQRAFGNEAEEHPNLEAIGKEIVRKCGGLPLAAKALGGLLRFKRGENEWLSAKESEIWNLPQGENSILPALMLSYYNLPLELRPCFSYCALFPKDSGFEKQTLIDLWMANGFISSNGKSELEDIGNEIWNELHWRSFFQDVEYDKFRNIESFKMHDLMHDLAQSVVVDECRIVEVGKVPNIAEGIRHVSLVTNSADSGQLVTIPEDLYKVESLRTLLPPQLMQLWGSYAGFMSAPTFRFLRVYVARGSKIRELSFSIGKLKHLRYLDLSRTRIRMLPESICGLWNLQTLKLDYCMDLERLPKQMRRLRNLRHLYMERCDSLTQMPPKIGHLSCLKMLSLFIVGEKRGFHLSELRGLNLRGRLEIRNLERVKDPKDAEEANFVGKQNLCELHLCWENISGSELQENAEQVLEALEPHPNLEQLFIGGYKGTRFPLWKRNPVLKNLVSIQISNCRNCVELPPFGNLPSLRFLYLEKMSCVEYIDNESRGGSVIGFPSLEELSLHNLPSLERLSREEGGELFPRLFKLDIMHCPKLTLPCSTSLKELSLWGNNEVALSSIPNLQSLTSLLVDANGNEAASFPDRFFQSLTSLRKLVIGFFTKLKVLPPDLVSLSALESLQIIGWDELESLDIAGFDNCERLESLSEGLEDLASLKFLHIYQCPKVASLPASIQSLTKLQTLDIMGCPQLERRCEKEIGEDWYKISHIPDVSVSL